MRSIFRIVVVEIDDDGHAMDFIVSVCYINAFESVSERLQRGEKAKGEIVQRLMKIRLPFYHDTEHE